MTVHRMIGGPFDGTEVEVPDGTSCVEFPLVRAGERTGRSLAELEPEIRFDYETGAIIAPAELVLTYDRARYDRTADGFVHRDTPSR